MAKTAALVILILSLVPYAVSAVRGQSNLSTRDQFIPFSQFLDQVRSATYKDYKSTPVRDESAYQDIQKHILDMYGGVVKPATIKSYVRDEYIDCVPFVQRPTIHLLNLTGEELTAPTDNDIPLPDFPEAKGAADEPRPISLLLALNSTDPHGNKMECERETVPLTRLTLDRITQYSTLYEFFRKPQATRSNPTNSTQSTKREV